MMRIVIVFLISFVLFFSLEANLLADGECECYAFWWNYGTGQNSYSNQINFDGCSANTTNNRPVTNKRAGLNRYKWNASAQVWEFVSQGGFTYGPAYDALEFKEMMESLNIPQNMRPSEYLPNGPRTNCPNAGPPAINHKGCKIDGKCVAFQWTYYTSSYSYSNQINFDGCSANVTNNKPTTINRAGLIVFTWNETEQQWQQYKFGGFKWGGAAYDGHVFKKQMESLGIPINTPPSEYLPDGPGPDCSFLCKDCNSGTECAVLN